MSELVDGCKKLNKLILDSNEYRTYIFARTSIRNHKDLYQQVVDFKKQYADIERYSEGNPYDELRRLYDENDELLHNSTVNEYLRAESSLSKLMKRVLDEVTAGINLDVE